MAEYTKDSPGRVALQTYSARYKDILHGLIFDEVKGKDPVFVLDVGCGKGMDLKKISSESPKIKGFGVDISKDSLETAVKRSNGSKDFHITQASAKGLPFKDNSFDLVFSSEVIEHFSRPEKMLEEVHRVLKDNGTLIITTPSRYNYTTLIGKIVPRKCKDYLRKLVYYMPQGTVGNPHVKEYTPGEMKRMFEENGFLVYRVMGGSLRIPIWPLFEHVPFLLAIWRYVDRFVDRMPFGIHLKLHFIMAGKKR